MCSYTGEIESRLVGVWGYLAAQTPTGLKIHCYLPWQFCFLSADAVSVDCLSLLSSASFFVPSLGQGLLAETKSLNIMFSSGS